MKGCFSIVSDLLKQNKTLNPHYGVKKQLVHYSNEVLTISDGPLVCSKSPGRFMVYSYFKVVRVLHLDLLIHTRIQGRPGPCYRAVCA